LRERKAPSKSPPRQLLPRSIEPPRASPQPPSRPARERGGNWLYGRHAVTAALANPQRRWRRLIVLTGQDDEAQALLAAARAQHRGNEEPLQLGDRTTLARILPEDAVHQGLALEVEPLEAIDLDDVIRATPADGRAIVLVLDQVSDPHNVGAILRSAAAFGALAVIVPEHGAPPVTATLAKAASGALDQVPLVRVTNLTRALERLKQAGYWCCGLDETGPAALATLALGARVVLVLGSEGGGLRRLLREHCDFLARLPTSRAQPSLNVSNAAAVALYELVRGDVG